jgi:hypothetical protein
VPPFSWVVAVTVAAGTAVRGGSTGNGVDGGLCGTLGRVDAGGTTGFGTDEAVPAAGAAGVVAAVPPDEESAADGVAPSVAPVGAVLPAAALDVAGCWAEAQPAEASATTATAAATGANRLVNVLMYLVPSDRFRERGWRIGRGGARHGSRRCAVKG